MSKIELTIRYAVLKQNHDNFGKMQNYVKVTLHTSNGATQYKTKIAQGDKNTKITWNEALSIPFKPSPQLYFQFSVNDEDTTRDDICGLGLLNLNTTGVLSNSLNKFNVQLHNTLEEEKSQITGELHVSTRLV